MIRGRLASARKWEDSRDLFTKYPQLVGVNFVKIKGPGCVFKSGNA